MHYIEEYFSRYGRSPSMQDIKTGCGFVSTEQSFRAVRLLDREGYIVYTPRKPRSIRLTKKRMFI